MSASIVSLNVTYFFSPPLSPPPSPRQNLASASNSPLTVRAVYGGVSLNTHLLALQGGTDVLVATPGRLLDCASKNACDLSKAEVVCVDEADRMMKGEVRGKGDEALRRRRVKTPSENTTANNTTNNNPLSSSRQRCRKCLLWSSPGRG